MGDSRITIERMTNGFSVRVCDPKIEEANRKRKSNGDSYSAYRDPYREYAFKTCKEALAFVEKVADKALPKDDYESSFDAAVAEDDGDE